LCDDAALLVAYDRAVALKDTWIARRHAGRRGDAETSAARR
jgi:hypothetical protein